MSIGEIVSTVAIAIIVCAGLDWLRDTFGRPIAWTIALTVVAIIIVALLRKPPNHRTPT